MHNNDQLTRGERIRLESLSQALGITISTNQERPSVQQIMDNAVKIEKFLKDAPEDSKGSN